jgi:polyketide synthase 12/myxalamid-type polyketide synthase MxaB
MVRAGRDQSILRGGEILVPKVDSFNVEPDRPSGPTKIRPDGTYLLTGGLGALGLRVARWLVDHGARHIVLVSRRGETSATEIELAHLRSTGAQIRAPRADAASREQVDSVLRDIRDWPPLRGVFHLAGVLDDRVVTRLDGESIESALRPKIAGAWNLHVATKGLPLDHFVVFSSFASLVGPAGQGNYAAGNAFLDALAHYRRAAGSPALSLNWGPWSGEGMAASLDHHHLDTLRRSGLRPLLPRDALVAMEAALHSGLPQTAVVDVNWQEMFREQRPAFLHKWAGHLAETPSRPDGPSDGILDGDADSIATRLTPFITGLIAEVLHDDAPQSFDVDRPLDEYGMDSLVATELKNRIASRLGVDLPVSHLLGGVTVTDLVQLIQEQHVNGHANGEAPRADDDGSETMEILL